MMILVGFVGEDLRGVEEACALCVLVLSIAAVGCGHLIVDFLEILVIDEEVELVVTCQSAEVVVAAAAVVVAVVVGVLDFVAVVVLFAAGVVIAVSVFVVVAVVLIVISLVRWYQPCCSY